MNGVLKINVVVLVVVVCSITPANKTIVSIDQNSSSVRVFD